MKWLAVVMAFVAFVFAGCGATYVKVKNSSTSNFGNVDVCVKDNCALKVQFNSVNKDALTDQAEWTHSDSLTVTITTSSPSKGDETNGVALTEGEVNVITVETGTNSSDDIKYAVATE